MTVLNEQRTGACALSPQLQVEQPLKEKDHRGIHVQASGHGGLTPTFALRSLQDGSLSEWRRLSNISNPNPQGENTAFEYGRLIPSADLILVEGKNNLQNELHTTRSP